LVGGDRDRDNHSRDAHAPGQQGDTQGQIVRVRADLGVGERAECGDGDSGEYHGAGANPVGEPAGVGQGEHGAEALWCQQQAGGQRAVAADLLVVQRHQDHHAEDR
jgi:hypothetical protein